LISGGDGFVAANLARALVRRNAYVSVAVRHQRPISTLEMLGEEPAGVDLESTDLMSFIAVQRLCNRQQIDTIYHLAASAVVGEAANAPISTCENNIIPALNLLEAARINGIPRVIIASTDKSYGDHADADDPERIPYEESFALRGMDVYSASKVCADMLAQTYAFQFKLPVLVARPCNIYGPGDLNFTRLVPRTIMRLMNGARPVINQGNDRVLREYIYIDDVVNAYLFLGENLERHLQSGMPRTGRATYGWAAYNIGSFVPSETRRPSDCANIRNVVQVIEAIAARVGVNPDPMVIPKPPNFIEIPDQYLDSSKLAALGFTPAVPFDQGLDRTIDWYKSKREYLSILGHKYLS
jgi:CDP-glucose 4,6-dehydratase